MKYLEFEKPVADLAGKIQELRALGDDGSAVGINDEIAKLETKADQALADVYAKLSRQTALHPLC